MKVGKDRRGREAEKQDMFKGKAWQDMGEGR